MRRFLAMLLAVVVPLALAPEVGAKVLLREAEVCGDSGCKTEPPRVDHRSGFELIGPLLETGRPTAPAATADGSRYRVTLSTRRVSGGDSVSFEYYPDDGYLHVLGEPGSELGGAPLNVGWVRLTTSELDAYDALTRGLTSFGAEDSVAADGDGAPWAIIGSVIAAAALAGLVVLLLVRRRGRRPDEPIHA